MVQNTSLYRFALLLCVLTTSELFAQGVFVKKLLVQQPTELDWRYAVSLHGETDQERMSKYVATKQQYDFFGPRRAPDRKLALILYVSPGNVPHEWSRFERICRQRGILFAGVRNAGNAQDASVRVRATFEVLGDVRRRYTVDPDRTYVAGFSGGAIVATRAAFALPELFGGLLCIGQRLIPPRYPTLLDRSSERLSVAALCGSNELVGPHVEHFDSPHFVAHGFRCQPFVSRGGGHKMPKATLLAAAVDWLEQSSKDRGKLAERLASTRANAKSHDEEKWSLALVEEAEKRWQDDQQRIAVDLLQWIQQRWPDSDAAKLASDKLAKIEPLVSEEELDRAKQEKEDHLRLILAVGHEKFALDRRAWLKPERRAPYAKAAIEEFEKLGDRIENRESRIAKLKEIATAVR